MPLAKGVSYLIGLGTEAYAHHKEKAARERSRSPDPGSPEHVQHDQTSGQASGIAHAGVLENVEDAWICDEAQTQLEPPRYSADERTVDQLVDDFARRHPPPEYAARGMLPCPVIIPQKRPESKMHGFMRAYAPVLEDSGIDQATFLSFLDNFTTSIKGEGYFNAVNLAIAAGVITYTAAAASVNPIVHFTAFAVHTSIEAGKRLHNTKQINKYLERMNEELFKPHGLYAMIMTYKPDSSDSAVPIDVNAHMLESVFARNGGDRSKFRTASGTTHGEVQLPECAPLVFPTLETAGPEERKNAFKRAAAFVSDYQDRRARSQFQHNNPDSKLNVGPQEQFSSIFADPNHAINRGGNLNVLTGGYLHKGVKALGQNGAGAALPLRVRRQAGKEKGGVGASKGFSIKSLIGENVLYLMIVNMPSEQELREAAQMEAEAGQFLTQGRG